MILFDFEAVKKNEEEFYNYYYYFRLVVVLGTLFFQSWKQTSKFLVRG